MLECEGQRDDEVEGVDQVAKHRGVDNRGAGVMHDIADSVETHTAALAEGPVLGGWVGKKCQRSLNAMCSFCKQNGMLAKKLFFSANASGEKQAWEVKRGNPPPSCRSHALRGIRHPGKEQRKGKSFLCTMGSRSNLLKELRNSG